MTQHNHHHHLVRQRPHTARRAIAGGLASLVACIGGLVFIRSLPQLRRYIRMHRM